MVLRRLLAAFAAVLCCVLFAAPAHAGTQRVGNLELSWTSLDFGTVLVGKAVARDVVIRNVGSSSASVNGPYLEAAFDFSADRFVGDIAPGASVTVQVRFTPSYPGVSNDALTFYTDQNNNDAGEEQPFSLDVTGTGAAPGDAGSPAELTIALPKIEGHDFNFVPTGTSVGTSVVVRNTGGSPLVVQPPQFSTSALSTTDFGSAPVTVAPSSSYTFSVRFTPKSAGGFSGLVTLQSNGGSDSRAFYAYVFGPLLASDPVVFPETAVGETATRTVTVTNSGDPTDVKSVLIEEGATKAGTSDFRVVSAPSQVDGSASFAFSFSPSGTGVRSAVARLVDAGGATLLRIPLSGNGVGAIPQVASQLSFGTIRVGRSLSKTLTISNVGKRDLTLENVRVDGAGAPFTVTGDLSPVPGGVSRALTVRFAPTADGAASASLRIDHAGAPSSTVALSGTGSSSLPLAPAPSTGSGGGVPTDVVTGDFDEDGKLDAVVGFAATGGVRFARGLGDGSFAVPVGVGDTGATGALALAAGDVNEDGHPDVVVTAATGSKVLRGAGDGSFTASALGYAADQVAMADFNDDGHLDLVGTLSSASVLSAVRRIWGAGDGTFSGLQTARLEGVGTGIAASDLQRDGDMDYVVSWKASTGATGVRFGLNDGAGGFSGTVPAVEAGGVAIGLFDAGLLPDVSVGGKLLLNVAATLVPGGTRGDVVRVADFDGDGKDDQVTAKQGESVVNLSLGNGAGGFASTVDVGTDAPGSTEPADLAVGDLDGDGRPDVLGALGGEQLTVLLNPSTASASGAGKAVLSELRFGGDAYVHVMNTSRTDQLSLDGWQLRFPGGRSFTFPAGTRIEPRGTALVTSRVNGAGAVWSLASVARGLVGVPASATGVALVDRRGTTVDAAGLTSAPAAFREGAGLPIITFRGQGAYVRKIAAGAWVDTNQNASDFRALDTAAQAGDPTILGAPRPDKPSDPTNRNDILQSSLIDPSKAASAAPNREIVDGKLVIRRVLTNCSGGLTTGACKNADPNAPAVSVTRVRFRITDLSTVGNSTGAILRAVPLGSSSPYTLGLQLRAPSPATGGGINATLTPIGVGELSAGLMPGQSFEVEFAFAVDRPGAFRFAYDTEDDLELLPKPVASPVAEEKVPEAPPVSEKVTGTAPVVEAPIEPAAQPSGSAPAPASAPQSAKAPAKPAATKKAKCVTRSQRSRLRGKARAKAKLCKPVKKRPTTTTGKAKR